MGIHLKLFILKLGDNDQQMMHPCDLQKMDTVYQRVGILLSQQTNFMSSLHLPSRWQQRKTYSNLFQFTLGILNKQSSLDEGNLEKQIKCNFKPYCGSQVLSLRGDPANMKLVI